MDSASTSLWFENVTSFNVSTTLSPQVLLERRLGPQTKNVVYVIILLFIYGLIFISGIVGNVCTCFVILKNNSLRTTTNYYLLSLAVSDVLILLLGLPPEAYSIYEEYPWRFGYVFCIIKALFAEMTSYASVLTITAFTVERYIAICHPLKAHKIATYSRCTKIIISIWLISLVCALPYPIHTDLFYYVIDDSNNPVPDSLICNIPNQYYERMMHVFQISTFLFFIFPLTVLIVLYSLIGLSLRRAELRRAASDECHHSNYSHRQSGNASPGHRTGSHCGSNEASPSNMPRKVVLKLLVAVVAAFFICWAPFHAQRLLTVYNRKWTPVLLQVQSSLFYISGVLYFIGSTVNPILYNVMSRRFRRAFTETICSFSYSNKHVNGTTLISWKHQRELDSKSRLVGRHTFSNHQSLFSKGGLNTHGENDENYQSQEMNGTKASINISNCELKTNTTESTAHRCFMYKPKSNPYDSRDNEKGQKVLQTTVISNSCKNKDFGIYI